ncbi:cytochrome P450 4V2-like isoform X1 [Pieris napi]|uniref:cytochrome P450 4V2-like isoform X1 n=1 Tax=Pieris napi TaxID=78633 RepID=UPI001FBA731D|nr:cytochrome P450 4V2-like isoform X1 [Pieris napi]
MWILFIAALCCLYLYTWVHFYPGKFPVYPGGIPFLGNVSILFSGDTEKVWETIKKIFKFSFENGDIVLIYFGPIPFYIITDPDDCNTVLTSSMHRSGIAKKLAKTFVGNGLLFSPVSVWKEHRKLINPTFNQQVLDGFMEIFNLQSRRLVQEWKENAGKDPFDQHLCLEKNAMETICFTTAGVDLYDQNEFNNKCLMAFGDIMNLLAKRAMNPLLYFDCLYNISDMKKEELQHVKITHELTNTVLKRKIESQDKEQDGKSNTKFKPFLERLLESSDKLSTQDLKDETNSMILAGFETTSAILSYCLVLLGTYTNVQEKCYQEINEVFGDSNRDVTKDDLPRLKYIEMVLKETMRLCPGVPYSTRVITEDVQLKNAVLRKGHLCFVALYGAMHHPTWGPDVEEFIPERWLDTSGLNPNAFGAFGYGRRNCVGKVYAMMTMKVTMVHILRAYRVSGDYHRMRIRNLGINKPVDGHQITLLNR